MIGEGEGERASGREKEKNKGKWGKMREKVEDEEENGKR